MPSDWEEDSDAAPAAPKSTAKPLKKKWEGEDEDDGGPVSDWEESSESEEDIPPSSAPKAPPKKKGTLKAKLAEKEAMAKHKKDEDSDEYDSDDVLDPKERERRDRQKVLDADLNNARDLFGSVTLEGTSSKELDSLLSFQPRTKEDFQLLSKQIIDLIIKPLQNKPLFPTFVEHHARELAMPLKDVEVRKCASALTTLANEKQKEQRDKASGKKKSKAATKPVLGSSKVSTRLDTSVYNEALDDEFGAHPDDFM